MTTNELMIGDYLQVEPSGMAIRIRTIHKKEVGYHTCQNRISFVKEELLDPIPLTPEILKKNGLVKKHDLDGVSLYYIKLLNSETRSEISFSFYDEPVVGVNTLLKIWFEFRGGVNQIHKCNVLYVHELQHALRLCGIEKEIEI